MHKIALCRTAYLLKEIMIIVTEKYRSKEAVKTIKNIEYI